MDVTALGGLLLGVGAVFGGVVTFFGKRGENAVSAYSSLTNDLQEERDRLSDRVDAQAKELERLRGLVIDMGGKP
ncbi:hypothetical protein [Streptomyces meridianus]|uniref:DNA recombination protein RmuC n=1 Tax=Streptomyces meridianus TaxID=2938945 RepID=A0ABT0XD44_9ACTN|nr:hypothetical protein [Streptomyces meridianus]MCM2580436.1 hypothetical protein [Streptomyces meridianus]